MSESTSSTQTLEEDINALVGTTEETKDPPAQQQEPQPSGGSNGERK